MNFRHMASCSHTAETGALGEKSKKSQCTWKFENKLRFLPTTNRKGQRRKTNSYNVFSQDSERQAYDSDRF